MRSLLWLIAAAMISENKANRQMSCEQAVKSANILWKLGENLPFLPTRVVAVWLFKLRRHPERSRFSGEATDLGRRWPGALAKSHNDAARKDLTPLAR
jgi:hypothetical protein